MFRNMDGSRRANWAPFWGILGLGVAGGGRGVEVRGGGGALGVEGSRRLSLSSRGRASQRRWDHPTGTAAGQLRHALSTNTRL